MQCTENLDENASYANDFDAAEIASISRKVKQVNNPRNDRQLKA